MHEAPRPWGTGGPSSGSVSVASHHRSAAVHFLALGWSLALIEVCEMLEALHTTHGSRVG